MTADDTMVLNSWNGRPTEMILSAQSDQPRYRELIIGHAENFDVWFETDFGFDDSTATIWEYTDWVSVWLVKDGTEIWRQNIWSWGGKGSVRSILEALELSMHGQKSDDALFWGTYRELSDWLDADNDKESDK